MDEIYAVAIIIVAMATLWLVLSIPGQIAARRRHKQTAAIRVLACCGVLFPPCWIAALIWALMRP